MPAFKLRAERVWRRTGRTLPASLRYLRLVVSEFSFTFLLILGLLAAGTFFFLRTPMKETGGLAPGWAESLFAAYSLFAFQVGYALPASLPLRIMYFLYPLIGLALVADAVVRVSLLLFSRQENQKEWTKVLASTYRDHVILCGLGRVGIRILERLRVPHRRGGHREGPGLVLPAEGAAAECAGLILDAKEEESLEHAGLLHARALIIATNDDLANVEIALDARRLKPGIRVVLRMFDEGIADKLREAFQLDVAFSSAASAAPMVAASVLEMDILGSFGLDGDEYFTVRLRIEEGSSLIGRPVGRLQGREEDDQDPILVVSLRRAAQGESTKARLRPDPNEPVLSGDEIVVQGKLDMLRRLNHLARQGRRLPANAASPARPTRR